jgi:pimeloyl-ACP methyl ester carboxylesterase
LDAAQVKTALLVGHSMGSLIALETAARHPSRVAGLGLVAAAAAMPVHPDLIAAAECDDPAAFAMVNLWGHGARATLGGAKAPGTWMIGQGGRVLASAPKGALAADMKACNAYGDGPDVAAKIAVPTTLILGGRDVMTPAAQGRALAALIAGASVVEAPQAGHMLPIEEPDLTLDALIALARRTAPITS